MRPNINLKDDMNWLEQRAERQNEAFNAWFDSKRNRSITVLELGAGPVQPLSREIGEDLLKTDTYRTALVRVNPIRERSS